MFKDLVPLDPFFACIYADDILESLKETGFKEIDISIKVIAARETMRLKNFCNIELIPPRIYYILYEMIIAAYLDSMYKSGKLPDKFNFDGIAGKIQLGDTSVELSGEPGINDMSEKKLLSWLSTIEESWRKEAITCRKLQW